MSKRMFVLVVMALLVAMVGVISVISYLTADTRDRKQARRIAGKKWEVYAIASNHDFLDYARTRLRLDLVRTNGEKPEWACLWVPNEYADRAQFDNLKLDDTLKFEASDRVVFPRYSDLPRYELYEGLGALRYLKIVDSPLERQWAAQKAAEEAAKREPNPDVVSLVQEIKKADADGDQRALRFLLWNYALTIQDWPELQPVADRYVLPAKFWNRQLPYHGRAISLSDAKYHEPKGTLRFIVSTEGSKARLIGVDIR